MNLTQFYCRKIYLSEQCKVTFGFKYTLVNVAGQKLVMHYRFFNQTLVKLWLTCCTLVIKLKCIWVTILVQTEL